MDEWNNFLFLFLDMFENREGSSVHHSGTIMKTSKKDKTVIWSACSIRCMFLDDADDLYVYQWFLCHWIKRGGGQSSTAETLGASCS